MRVRMAVLPELSGPTRMAHGLPQAGMAKTIRRCCITLTASLLLTLSAWPQDAPKDLAEKTVEDLMNIEVTSVSKKEQKLSRIAAAIFIINQDDIRRSGATNIPDLLRMVPGLDVAQINGSAWAISSRGLNSQLANKLLVLIDGRSVYSPLFAGVYWNVQDVPLENIERVEVIRGPGATVWGTNAVNGVINIITKSAKETQGALLVAGGGTREPIFGVAQYGGQINQAANYRFFVKGFDQNSLPSLSGNDGHDGSHLLHGGFRVDSILSKKDSLTLHGDLYEGGEGEVVHVVALTPPFGAIDNVRENVSGGNLLGLWNHTFSSHSDTSLQVYFDSAERRSIVEGESLETVDIDFQHHLSLGSRQDIVWGAGYRHVSYSTTGSLNVSFHPPNDANQLFSSFVQTEITLKPDRLYLTGGIKIEHNDFTGLEFQPSARIAWNVSKNHMLWAAYSKARRIPSLVDQRLKASIGVFPAQDGLPVLLTVSGSPNTVDEDLAASEAGYRTQVRANLSLDIAAYYNRYDDLQTIEPATPFFESNPLPPHLNVPIIFANLMHGETHGIEIAVNWKITDRWALSPGYAFEQIHLHTEPNSRDATTVPAGDGGTPHHQAQLRSHLSLPRAFEWDTSVFFVDQLPAQHVPSYARLDSGITWRASERLAFSVFGQNLLRDHHLEANSAAQSELPNLIKRSVYLKLTWQF